jgi:hypothetical protein
VRTWSPILAALCRLAFQSVSLLAASSERLPFPTSTSTPTPGNQPFHISHLSCALNPPRLVYMRPIQPDCRARTAKPRAAAADRHHHNVATVAVPATFTVRASLFAQGSRDTNRAEIKTADARHPRGVVIYRFGRPAQACSGSRSNNPPQRPS